MSKLEDRFNRLMEYLIDRMEFLGEFLIIVIPIYLIIQLLRIWLW